MIQVKKINQQEIVVNCELIETIEFCPHAVISMTSGQKIIIDQDPEEIIRKVIEYKRAIGSRPIEFRTENAPAAAIEE